MQHTVMSSNSENRAWTRTDDVTASSTSFATRTMKSVLKELNEAFNAAIRTAMPIATENALVAPCGKVSMGHYQCNSAMSLFGKYKGQDGCPKNPRAASDLIVAALKEQNHPMIGKVDVAGPGFINVFLKEEFLNERVKVYLQDHVPPPPIAKRLRCIVDFSSPNIAKEMHVGHLRSTIIGDTICRVLEHVGHDVVRVNHVGDWGTQFGMLIAHLKDTHPNFLQDPPAIGDLQAFYKESKKRFDEEDGFKSRAHAEVVKLQSGDVDCLSAWRLFCDVSRKEFEKLYSRLDVHLTERGESFYNPIMPGMVEEFMQRGLVRESDGAQCFFVQGKEVPLMIRKRDGGFTYDTTDMAAIRHRLHDEAADWLVYVTDAGQEGHFELIFKAAQEAGWVEPSKRIDHVAFGVVLGQDGKKFKTRSGDTVRLVDLLDEAKERCKKELVERKSDMSPEELDATAEAMGYGAVKYYDLSKNRISTYQFDYDAMCDLKGNTAVYMLYSHARICSIIRNSGVDVNAMRAAGATPKAVHPSEVALAMHMIRFPEIVEATMDDLMPNRLTDYVYELAGKFNDFYRDCRVVGDEQQESRVLLCEATARVMRQVFQLLGIRPVYKI